MSTPLLPGALWNLIQPLLPLAPPRPNGGRPRLPEGFRWPMELTGANRNDSQQALALGEAFLSLGCALICWRFLRIDWAAE